MIEEVERFADHIRVHAFAKSDTSREAEIDSPEARSFPRISAGEWRTICRGVKVLVDVRPNQQVERPAAVSAKNRRYRETSRFNRTMHHNLVPLIK